MKLSDLLQDEWTTVPLVATDLPSALDRIADTLGEPDEAGRDRLLAAFEAEGAGEIVRVTDDIVLAEATTDAVRTLSVAVGLADTPFDVLAPGAEGTARVLVLVASPEEGAPVRFHVVPTFTRILRESQRTRELLASRLPVDPAEFTAAVNAELHGRLLVEDAVTPARFRVYPDTPLAAVVDLIVRKGLERVPVVGEAHELLGVISAGDVLREVLPRWRSEPGRPPAADRQVAARDFMQRSVMCVSEEQSLLDAANVMVNRDVDELPVVREGVLVGFLERETVLKALFMS
jgi:CBS domain-containing protein